MTGPEISWELENVVERAVVLTEKNKIEVSGLPFIWGVEKRVLLNRKAVMNIG